MAEDRDSTKGRERESARERRKREREKQRKKREEGANGGGGMRRETKCVRYRGRDRVYLVSCLLRVLTVGHDSISPERGRDGSLHHAHDEMVQEPHRHELHMIEAAQLGARLKAREAIIHCLGPVGWEEAWHQREVLPPGVEIHLRAISLGQLSAKRTPTLRNRVHIAL